MTVTELIDILSKIDSSYIVVLQRDPEGNGYAPCTGAEEAKYAIDSLSGEGTVPHPDDDDGSGQPCVVLWP